MGAIADFTTPRYVSKMSASQANLTKPLPNMVPTTGLEPINGVFSPLPMIASFNVFIAHTVTRISNHFKHYLCICGKSREENRVQIVCKKTVCANFVQANVTPDSVQTCAKIFSTGYVPVFASGLAVARPASSGR
jgi:hypothetical protein